MNTGTGNGAKLASILLLARLYSSTWVGLEVKKLHWSVSPNCTYLCSNSDLQIDSGKGY